MQERASASSGKYGTMWIKWRRPGVCLNLSLSSTYRSLYPLPRFDLQRPQGVVSGRAQPLREPLAAQASCCPFVSVPVTALAYHWAVAGEVDGAVDYLGACFLWLAALA